MLQRFDENVSGLSSRFQLDIVLFLFAEYIERLIHKIKISVFAVILGAFSRFVELSFREIQFSSYIYMQRRKYKRKFNFFSKKKLYPWIKPLGCKSRAGFWRQISNWYLLTFCTPMALSTVACTYLFHRSLGNQSLASRVIPRKLNYNSSYPRHQYDFFHVP